MRDWHANYQEGDTPWDRGQCSPLLLSWLQDQENSTARAALVPGCGRGHEVVELAQRGFRVTGLDIVSQALEECQENLSSRGLKASLENADVLHWQASRPFDLIYEQTCLCAIDPQFWRSYEQQLRRWIDPGGTLLIAFMQTGQSGGPPFDCPLQEMRALFGDWHWSPTFLRVDRAGASNHELGFSLRPKI